MFIPNVPSLGSRQKITAEAYQDLKRRLFTLRCQHAALLRTIESKGVTESRLRRAKIFEQRISNLELSLAFSEVTAPAEQPLTFKDLLRLAKQLWARTHHSRIT